MKTIHRFKLKRGHSIVLILGIAFIGSLLGQESSAQARDLDDDCPVKPAKACRAFYRGPVRHIHKVLIPQLEAESKLIPTEIKRRRAALQDLHQSNVLNSELLAKAESLRDRLQTGVLSSGEILKKVEEQELAFRSQYELATEAVFQMIERLSRYFDRHQETLENAKSRVNRQLKQKGLSSDEVRVLLLELKVYSELEASFKRLGGEAIGKRRYRELVTNQGGAPQSLLKWLFESTSSEIAAVVGASVGFDAELQKSDRAFEMILENFRSVLKLCRDQVVQLTGEQERLRQEAEGYRSQLNDNHRRVQQIHEEITHLENRPAAIEKELKNLKKEAKLLQKFNTCCDDQPFCHFIPKNRSSREDFKKFEKEVKRDNEEAADCKGDDDLE